MPRNQGCDGSFRDSEGLNLIFPGFCLLSALGI